MSSSNSKNLVIEENLFNFDNKEYITSLSQKLDQILGGGFATGRIYEIAGESGLGKSQLCYQLCVNVQIPAVLGGLNGSVVYIDNESNFSSRRVSQIANFTVNSCNTILKENNKEESIMSVDQILSRIYLFRCMDIVQFLAATHNMDDFIRDHPDVKLIIVDSVAHWIRSEEDFRTRTVVLNNLAVNFRKMSMLNNLSVVLINQVTTKFNGQNSFVVPALGESWSYVPNVKLMLCKQDNNTRHIFLYKSCELPKASCQYQITGDGFRGIGNELHLTIQDVVSHTKLSNTNFQAIEPSKSQSNNYVQDISEKWIELSQQQIQNIIDPENDPELNSISDHQASLTNSNSNDPKLKNMNDLELNSNSDHQTSTEATRPTSPILSFKKKRRRCKLVL